jgi:hypothetical protein
MQDLMEQESQYVGIKEKEKRTESREIVEIGQAVRERDQNNEAQRSRPDRKGSGNR